MAHCVWIGIDVSSAWLDVATYPATQNQRFAYTDEGIAALQAWAGAHGEGCIAMEATGGMERRLAYKLLEAGCQVRIVNPQRVRSFARAITPAKNDPLDAQMIAHFAATVDGPPVTRDQEREDLAAMIGLRQLLSDQITALRNNATSQTLTAMRDLATKQIKQMRSALRAIEAQIDAAVAACAQMARRRALLVSMPAVGPVVSAGLLALLPELGQLSPGKIAALVGVAPFDDQSGGRNGARHIRGGRAELRKLLYMAALVASRRNKVMKEFYDRLRGRGKPAKVALMAVVHKMLTRLNAMLRTDEPWNDDHVSARA